MKKHARVTNIKKRMTSKKMECTILDYEELPDWIKKAEEEINRMDWEEFCDEMIKFGLEAKKVGGVKNLVFREVK